VISVIVRLALTVTAVQLYAFWAWGGPSADAFVGSVVTFGVLELAFVGLKQRRRNRK
jgi:hypothetical protein